MATFVSTTTPSGYSDPLKAMTIKALEQRQKDLLAQQANAGGITPENTQTPIQGMGHLANIMGDRFTQSRSDAALVAQKEAMARAISGYDPNSGPPPAAIATADPDIYKSMLTTWAENRRAQQAEIRMREMQKESLTHSSAEAGLTREQQKVLAEAADRRAREMQHESLTATSTEAGLTRQQQKELAEANDRRARELQTEQLTHTDARADKTDTRIVTEGDKTRAQQTELQKERLAAETANEKAKLDAAKETRASDPKRNEAIRSAETDYRKGLSHIDNLEEATKILEHPKGIYTGAMQNIAPGVSGVPGASMFVDKEKAQRTSRFNTIVGEDAIRDMAKTLVGSSTNFEMNEFKKMKNDPNWSDAQRATQLRRVVKAARADLEAQAKETQAVGGDVSRVDRAMKGGADAAADPLEGRTANGPDGPLVRRGGQWVKP